MLGIYWGFDASPTRGKEERLGESERTQEVPCEVGQTSASSLHWQESREAPGIGPRQGRKVDVERPLLLEPAAAGFLRRRENSGSGGFDTQFVGINLPVPQERSSHPSSISQLKEPM